MSEVANKKKIRGRGKKYSAFFQMIEKGKLYKVTQGVEVLKKASLASFDETFEVAFVLGVDPKKSDQVVRGAVVLPHGVGKKVRIAVIAKGEAAKAAEQAGAETVGAEELIEKIKKGWLEFDRLIATPDMMVAVSKIGKILGPKGLMPNPKLGTVTLEVGKAVEAQKKGSVQFRTDKGGVVHAPFGKKTFSVEQLAENFFALLGAISRAKPSTSKGTYVRKIFISTTMSPAVAIHSREALAEI